MADSLCIAIVGPTASGKTKLSVRWAKRWNAQVISLDSGQTYRAAPILSAQALPAEQDGVPHHMIGYLGPLEEPRDFVKEAVRTIDKIRKQGDRVIIVGGSISLSLPLLLHPIVRALKPHVIVLDWNTQLLDMRIELRLDQMLESDLEEELNHLWSLEQSFQPASIRAGVWKVIGYQEFRSWVAMSNRRAHKELFQKSCAALLVEHKSYAARQKNYIENEMLPALSKVGYPIHHLRNGQQVVRGMKTRDLPFGTKFVAANL